ncbi:hypothetical protein LJC56_11525 [Christensenellaceae bacterium OttesenSCG-928-K19]|nr:hypothetical protein [Christensenellaceae bacterium OttesenSCG-928-K19]
MNEVILKVLCEGTDGSLGEPESNPTPPPSEDDAGQSAPPSDDTGTGEDAPTE